MQILTDAGCDLAPEQLAEIGIPIHRVPLTIHLDGKTYRSGIDIQFDEFYELLESTDAMPTTSLPSPAEIAAIYRELAKDDPDILSIHISSGLSGTFNSARVAAEDVPEANITLWDSKTLSGGQGWQVAAAAKAVEAGWPLDRILSLLKSIHEATNTMFTIARLDYLLHGGRISHIKGLVGSLLNIKPIIEVDKVLGNYQQISAQRTFKKGIRHLSEVIAQKLPKGSAIRAQIGHGDNPEGVALLKSAVEADFEVEWLPATPIAPVLGAHTGPGLVGLIYGPRMAYEGLQGM